VTPSTPGTATVAIALFAGIAAIAGVAAIWAGIAAITMGQTAWMAIVAALDAALLMRLAGWPGGRSRAALALANALVATAQIGRAMGMRPYDALPAMSVELAALHARSNTGWVELVCYVVAMAIAWRLGR
jgi:hypothetical protein